MDIQIRPANTDDANAIRDIFREVIQDGTSYVFAADTPDKAIHTYWFAPETKTFVAEDRGWVLGMYKLMPAFPGHGSHLATASFMVAPGQQRRGIGTRLAGHCLIEAKKAGFRAMLFPYIISTNEGSVSLWRKIGFTTIGTVPGGFNHSELGFVDTYIMFRTLEDIPD